MVVFSLSGCQSTTCSSVEPLIKEEIAEEKDIRSCEDIRHREIPADMGIDIDEEQKAYIDKWIEENDLNRYGDPKDTMYIGGTPLFDESTGKRMDRYQYIIMNHPELLNQRE